MTYSNPAYDGATLKLVTAAHESAWWAATLGLALTDADRTNMATAISNAVACGQRDFRQLQQSALEVLYTRRVTPTERRLVTRPVANDRRTGAELVLN